VRFAFFALSFTALLAIVVSSVLYQNLVYHEEELGLNRIVELKFQELDRNLIRMMKKLGLGLQSETDFKKAIKKNDRQEIYRFLNNEFSQYFVTAEILSLQKIYLLDTQMQYLGESSLGHSKFSMNEPICPKIKDRAKTRKGASRLKVISNYCLHNNKPFLSIIVPVGTLKPIAYLQVIVDPIFNLAPIGNSLNLEIRINSISGKQVYVSSLWPSEESMDDFIFTQYDVENYSGEKIFEINIAKPITEYRTRFINTTVIVLLITSVLIFIVLIIVFNVLTKGLNAIKRLETSAENIANGDYQTLENSKYTEIDKVIQAFNLMTTRVKNSKLMLEEEVQHATKNLSLAIKNIETKNDELQAAIKMSEQANDAKSIFLGNMSHELRTPLNAIIGYSEMLKEEAIDRNDTTAQSDLDRIYSSGKHLLNIVNEILDLSKIEAGKIDLFIETFSLSKLIKEVYGTELDDAQVNVNKLILELDTSDVMILTSDEMRVKQVLLNLLNNACKFTKNGEITLSAKRYKGKSDFKYELKVTDTGIGLKEEELPTLFKAFKQADLSTTKEYGGTGLGLTLTKQFVELLGGTIQVKSVYGEGSEFTILLGDLH